jgi:hypothetical protein
MSAYHNIEVLVSDNGSTDRSLEMIRAEFPFAKVVENRRNLGFAEGNNAAILSAGGDFLFLLNNDATIDPGCIRELLNVACSDQRIGILGCKVYLARNGEKILEHAGGVIYPSGYTTSMGYLRRDHGQYDQVRDVDYVLGAAMMVARPVIQRAGFLDPLFVLYYEETDLCYRARMAGFRIVFVPQAIVHHRHALTVDKFYGYQARRDHMETSRVSFVLKNFAVGEVPTWIVGELRILAGLLLSPSKAESRSHLLALLRSYCWNLSHLRLTMHRRRRGAELRALSHGDPVK